MRFTHWTVLSVLALLTSSVALLHGCGGDRAPAAGCTANSACPVNEYCLEGVCTAPPDAGSGAPDGSVASPDASTSPADSGSNTSPGDAGQPDDALFCTPCTEDSDCGAGNTCLEEGAGQFCGLACTSNADCPMNAFCGSYTPDGGTAVMTCVPQRGCRMGGGGRDGGEVGPPDGGRRDRDGGFPFGGDGGFSFGGDGGFPFGGDGGFSFGGDGGMFPPPFGGDGGFSFGGDGGMFPPPFGGDGGPSVPPFTGADAG